MPETLWIVTLIIAVLFGFMSYINYYNSRIKFYLVLGNIFTLVVIIESAALILA